MKIKKYEKKVKEKEKSNAESGLWSCVVDWLHKMM